MKRILTNKQMRRTMDTLERARLSLTDLPMFRPGDLKPPATSAEKPAAPAPVPRLKHK